MTIDKHAFTARALIAALVVRLGGDVTLTFEEIDTAPTTVQDGLPDAIRLMTVKSVTTGTGPNLPIDG